MHRRIPQQGGIAARAARAALLAVACALAIGPALAQDRPRPAAVSVSGAVRAPVALDLAALQLLPRTTVTVGSRTYTGASLWALLNSVGIAFDASRRNPGVSMYVVATGEDGYRAVFSLAEIDPALGGRPVLVAYEANGSPLQQGGVARLVVPGDAKPSRAVFGLVELRVQSAQ